MPCIAVIAEGEVNQLTAQRQIDVGRNISQHYRLENSGAICCRLSDCRGRAERDHDTEEALDAYGRNLGIAFQLVDDAIDYASDAGTMGKDIGDDFRDGKMTLPVILAYARGSEADRAFWKDAVEGRRVSDTDLVHATQLLRNANAIDDTIERARHFGQRAIDALGPFSRGAAKSALVEAVEFAISRAY